MGRLTHAVAFAMLGLAWLHAGELPAVRSVPANDAVDVSPAVGEIVFHFAQRPSGAGLGVGPLPGFAFPPVLRDELSWRDARTLVAPVDALKPIPRMRYGSSEMRADKGGLPRSPATDA